MKNIEKAISFLLRNKPFFAHFFLNCRIKYDNKAVPTMGVKATTSGVEMIINTEFEASLTEKEIGAVIEHEVLHILFNHIEDIANNTNKLESSNMNIAMDVAINQYIDNLPDDCWTLDALSKACGVELKGLQTWEYYYQAIVENATPINLTSLASIDDHSMWEKSEQLTSGQKAAIRQAVDAAIKASAGNIPNAVVTYLGNVEAENSKLPWQQILSNFVSRHAHKTRIPTRKKLHRRFEDQFPGYKKKKELILGVCTDSSGSISDESYLAFMTEISRLSSLCHTIYWVDADCSVQNVTTIKKHERFDAKRYGGGGTAYQPAISKCKELKCDIIIYFGDFDTSDTPEDPKVPFLWVGVGNSPKPADFGYEIRL